MKLNIIIEKPAVEEYKTPATPTNLSKNKHARNLELYITNINFDTTENTLRKHFGAIGPL